MNVKQKLSRIYFGLYCFFFGYCPTQGEIRNSNIKSLANRLRAESYEETLTNIVEWQERNIEFWTERHPILIMLIPNCVISGLVSFIGAFSFVSLIFGSIQPLLLLACFIVIWFVSLVSGVATTLAIMIVILHSNRKIPWKEVPRGLKNIFVPSISIEFLLENKLGVCRDYAKLTACLLSNIYPNEEVYFAHAPSHTATGIMVRNNLYMLDQRLPILTIDKWDSYRHLKKVERFTKNSLKAVDINSLLSTTKTTALDTKELAMRMTKLLNIREQTDDKAVSLLEIPWKKGAILYKDNEMVDYSLGRRLKMKISNELIRINQITRIEIERHKDDLMFRIRFSLE